MDRFQARADVPPERDRLLGRERSDGLDEVVEALALDVFHADEEHPVRLAEVVHTADVGVGDFLGQGQLAAEALARLLLRAGARAHELERDRLAEGAVDGLVDLAHAPRADLLHEGVAIAEALAGGDTERSDSAR